MKWSQIKKRQISGSVLSALELGAKDYRERDTNNLYFRVSATGAKTWQFRYKSNDK